MVAAERRQVDERVRKIIELKDKVKLHIQYILCSCYWTPPTCWFLKCCLYFWSTRFVLVQTTILWLLIKRELILHHWTFLHEQG
jgi:hypothetical protein